MEKIKILHITQPTVGGTIEYIKLFFKYIDKEKYEVELICPPNEQVRNYVEKMGIRVRVVDMKREINPVDDFKAYIKLKKYIKNAKPNIVHLHSSKAGILGRLAAYRNKVPCVYNPHGWSFSMDIGRRKKNIYSSIERFCSRFTDKIINVSDNEFKLALKYKVASAEKMTVIYNGIDIEQYKKTFDNKATLKELGIPENSYVIGMIGRLTNAKSPETFIEVANILSKEVSNSYFILIGDGELRTETEKLIVQKDLQKKIIITGWTDNVGKYLSVLNVGLLTSRWEGFGLVLLEYMATGKPIVASNVGGISNVITNGYNGVLVETGDVEGFCDAIIRIKNDTIFREKLVKGGYDELTKRFDVRDMVKKHDKLYEFLYKRYQK